MKNISNISTILNTTATPTKYSPREDGFKEMLDEAMSVAAEKEAGVNQARRERSAYPLNSIDQSVSSSSQMKSTLSAQTYLSANMISLYRDQENKNERSGKPAQ